MSSSIGIKIANGEFYPILSEIKPSKKRMVLTTVHDGQKSVQIDLYRSEMRAMSDAQYVGSLVVEKLKNRKKGEPSVELVVAQDNEGGILAEAQDLDNPKKAEKAKLSVSLNSPEGGADIDFGSIGLGDEERAIGEVHIIEKKSRSRLPLIILAVLLALLTAGFAVWWFVLGGSSVFLGGGTEDASPPDMPVVEAFPPESETVIVETPVQEIAPPAQETQPEPVAETPPPVTETPPKPVVIETTEQPKVISQPPPVPSEPVKNQTSVPRQRAPVWSFKVPEPFPEDGVEYQVDWGDTLWDISHVFYRDPWRYVRIADYNGLENPNRIISGDWLIVPHPSW